MIEGIEVREENKEKVKVIRVILQHGIIRVCQLRLRGAWLHGI